MQALLNKHKAGIPVKLIIDPAQYTNDAWPQYWLTHANLDTLYAAGVPILQRKHAGVTHMKTLITSSYATNASSNFSPNWQRDHDYFVSAATQPTIYQAFVTTFARTWTDTTNFGPMVPTPPRAPALVAPASGGGGVSVTGKFAWKRASWAVSYDVYLGTSPSALTRVANVPAQLVQNPPSTYSWTPSPSLQPNTTYYWKVLSRTNATVVNPSLVAASSTLSFSTAGSSGGGGNLVQQPGFEGYAPPSLGLPGSRTSHFGRFQPNLKRISRTPGPRTACAGRRPTPTAGCTRTSRHRPRHNTRWCSTRPPTARAAWIGANVNGHNMAAVTVSASGFGHYQQYVMHFQASAGAVIRVWMYSPPTLGYVVIDDVSLTTP